MGIRLFSFVFVLFLLVNCSVSERSSFVYIDQQHNEYHIHQNNIDYFPFEAFKQNSTPTMQSIRIDDIDYAEIKTMMLKASTSNAHSINNNALQTSIVYFASSNENDSFIFDKRSIDQFEVDQYLESLFNAALEQN